MNSISPTIIQQLDEKLTAVLAEMRAMPTWRALVAAGGTQESLPPLLIEMAEAADRCSAAVDHLLHGELSRLPASLPTRTLRSLFEGDAHYAQKAVKAGETEGCIIEVVEQWKVILRWCDPFALMGACYLCKSLWPSWVKAMKEDLKAMNLTLAAREVIKQREKAGRKKVALLRALIEDIEENYPQTGRSMINGFEALLEVYPLRFWSSLAQSHQEVAEWGGERDDQMRVG